MQQQQSMYGDIVDYDADCAEKVSVTITRSSARVIAFPGWDKFWTTRLVSNAYLYAIVAEHVWRHFGFTPATNRYYQWASTKFWKIDRLQIRFPSRLASNAYLYAILAEHVWRHFASHLLPTATTSELLRSTFQGSCLMLLGTCRVSCFAFCVVYLSCPFSCCNSHLKVFKKHMPAANGTMEQEHSSAGMERWNRFCD